MNCEPFAITHGLRVAEASCGSAAIRGAGNFVRLSNSVRVEGITENPALRHWAALLAGTQMLTTPLCLSAGAVSIPCCQRITGNVARSTTNVIFLLPLHEFGCGPQLPGRVGRHIRHVPARESEC